MSTVMQMGDPWIFSDKGGLYSDKGGVYSNGSGSYSNLGWGDSSWGQSGIGDIYTGGVSGEVWPWGPFETGTGGAWSPVIQPSLPPIDEEFLKKLGDLYSREPQPAPPPAPPSPPKEVPSIDVDEVPRILPKRILED